MKDGSPMKGAPDRSVQGNTGSGVAVPRDGEFIPDANLLIGRVDGSTLARNIAFFGRLLRRCGIPVGPSKIMDAIDAVLAVGLENRDDVYWALHATLVNRHEFHDIFDQAFHIYWKSPDFLEKALGLTLPSLEGEAEGAPTRSAARRAVEAALDGIDPPKPAQRKEDRQSKDAVMTFSDRDRLARKDFEQMSREELIEAQKMIEGLTFEDRDLPTRRFMKGGNGRRIDLRSTLRASARTGGSSIELRTMTRRFRTPPLVVLCDISGSMERYSRMLLHFLHALSSDRERMHVFLFGTQLTNITRFLKDSDPDAAIARISNAVGDWSGGTRIGQCLHEFNRCWSRRVLGQGATVLLITDGLDREGGAGLEDEIDRLHRSSRRLIWLNPLLRYDRYAPKSKGAKILIRHVDEFRPVHDFNSLKDLAKALSGRPEPIGSMMGSWREKSLEPSDETFTFPAHPGQTRAGTEGRTK